MHLQVKCLTKELGLRHKYGDAKAVKLLMIINQPICINLKIYMIMMERLEQIEILSLL